MSYFLYCLVKKENIIIASLFFLLSWQEFAISLIWTSPGSAYAYRYLMNLAPLGVLFLCYMYKIMILNILMVI